MGSFAIRKHFFAAAQKEKNFEISLALFMEQQKYIKETKKDPTDGFKILIFLSCSKKMLPVGKTAPMVERDSLLLICKLLDN